MQWVTKENSDKKSCKCIFIIIYDHNLYTENQNDIPKEGTKVDLIFIPNMFLMKLKDLLN